IQYGVSFNTMYAGELGLDWREVYTAVLDDLQVRHLRLAAHWPMVEPKNDEWNFEELDTQVRMAEERHADIVLALGRRLPRWPECHVPEWAQGMTWEEQKNELRTYLRKVVEQYKESPAVVYWQVENEPFLTVYAHEKCGDLDTTFLDEEVALVRELDPTRPILVTDSGNLGLWYGAYKRGDSFGTSVYRYLWNETTGPIQSILPAETYILKRTTMSILFGAKESMLIELSVEPWLNKPIVDTDIKVQLERMDVEKFEGILDYAQKTRFEKQYLWGAEWWYWLRTQGRPGMWDRAKKVYNIENIPS
ncbi:MAG: beta-galactosidase, partial [Candidatus Pacebacteria bacterium]|nr:beta-galactosidase [Candidatus Paceibacterota bacterium]